MTNKSQYPKKHAPSGLEFLYWSLFVIWQLFFGVFLSFGVCFLGFPKFRFKNLGTMLKSSF